jgi:apolipoprotein N-acyltransferase
MTKAGQAVVATAASGLLFFFGTGLHPVPELAWPAPLPIFLLAPRVPGAAAFTCALVAHLAGGSGSWSYFWQSLSVPRPAGIAILGGGALLFAASVTLFRLLVRRGHGLLAALAAPALWTVVMGTLMTTQARPTGVLRLAAVTGPVTRIALIAPGQSRWAADAVTPDGQALVQSYVDQIGRLPDRVQAVVGPAGSTPPSPFRRPAPSSPTAAGSA